MYGGLENAWIVLVVLAAIVGWATIEGLLWVAGHVSFSWN